MQRTLRILETLRETGGAGVTTVAKETGYSKATVHNHLATLEHEEYVVRTGDGTYELGFRFLDLAHHARRRIGIYDLVRREVDKLAAESGEMALYTVEEHGWGVCIYRELGENAVQTPLYVGYRSALHHTAVGKAILAYLPRSRVEAIIKRRGLTVQTEDTITDPDQLFDELDAIRDRGFAFNREETIPGLVGVGAPIIGQGGTVEGAISIIGPASRMDEERFYGEIPDMITRSVNIIEINATSI
ncbi:IclR family transcriptional regulator domain-containing protein [Halomarina oriensis]|uniref:IclR family transcriptional regulator n=1 Tax=Halomarina oriensis TaxID=671145 RepID=UPI0034A3FA55